MPRGPRVLYDDVGCDDVRVCGGTWFEFGGCVEGSMEGERDKKVRESSAGACGVMGK